MDEISRIRAVYAERDQRPPHAHHPGRRAMIADRNAALDRLLRRFFDHPIESARILDVGCGKGTLLGWFYEQGVPAENLFGIDLRPRALSRARATYPDMTFVDGNAEVLPFRDSEFDLVTAFTVFSSILSPTMRYKVAREMARVLTPSGAICYYDMRMANPFNPHIRPLLPTELAVLFPGFRGRLEANTLLPPLATRLGPFTEFLYPKLARIPLLRSHMIGFLKPK
jgi:SAM-dependent methyltransferase